MALSLDGRLRVMMAILPLVVNWTSWSRDVIIAMVVDPMDGFGLFEVYPQVVEKM